MSSTINLFLKKELTCLPSLFTKYINKNFNNALGNGITWMFFIWLLIHFTFHKFMDALLQQMKYPEFFRQRVITALWSLGFSFFSFVYCLAILSTNNFFITELYAFNQLLYDKSSENVPSQYIIGFVILCTYFAQSAMWEGSQNGCNDSVLYNLLYTMLSLLTYIKGWSEIVFALITLSSLTQTMLEVAKIFSFMQIYNRIFMKRLSRFWFGSHCIACFIMYAIILPLQFLIPCVKNFKNDISFSVLLLNILLWIWYILSIGQSAVFRMAKHYVYHMHEFSQTECKLDFIECSMFPPRTDAIYEVGQVKREIERRKEFLQNQYKKPNKLAFYQTLKCMMTVKRKLKHRRTGNETSPSCSSSGSPSSTSDADVATVIASEIINEMLSNIDISRRSQPGEVKTLKCE